MSEEVQFRPSGAMVFVTKMFKSAEDCQAQAALMRAAGDDVSMPIDALAPQYFTMPIAVPRVPPRAFADLMLVYERLWAKKSVRDPVSPEAYHAYVTARMIDVSGDIAERDTQADMFRRAQAAADSLRPLDIDILSAHPAFSHGDATLSNAVYSQRNGVRLIDFSPRPTPSLREIDVAKLRFSAMGFDCTMERRREFSTILDAWQQTLSPALDATLVKYYLATHLVRVMSREPAKSRGRLNFYQGVLNHVSKKL